jgi:hypothetical protein
MTTLIDTSILPESVQALVSHWRYFKHDIETSIGLLKKHREWVKKHRDTDGLSYQETYDLIANLEDLFDRGIALERKTFPEDFPRNKRASISNTEPSSNALDYEFPEANI